MRNTGRRIGNSRLSLATRSCLTRERSRKRQEKAEWEEGREEKREEKMKSRFGASGNGVALSLFSKPAPQPESKKINKAFSTDEE